MNAIDNYLWLTPTLVGARTSAKYFTGAGKTIVAYPDFDQSHYDALPTDALKQSYLNLCTTPISGSALDARCTINTALSGFSLVGSVRNPYDSFVSQWRRHVIGNATGLYRSIIGQTIQPTYIKNSIAQGTVSTFPMYVSHTSFKDYIAKLVIRDDYRYKVTSPTLSTINYTTYKYSQVANIGKFLNQNNLTLDYVIHYETLSADSFDAPFIDQTSAAAISAITGAFANNVQNTIENAEYLRALITVKCINKGLSALADEDYNSWVTQLSSINTILAAAGGSTFSTCLTPEYADRCYSTASYSQYRDMFSTDKAPAPASLYGDWRVFYDDWTATAIWNEYRETFEMFGYSRTSYLSS
jgi:hypothetical protein